MPQQLKGETYARLADDVHMTIAQIIAGLPSVGFTNTRSRFCVSLEGIALFTGETVGDDLSREGRRKVEAKCRELCYHLWEHRSDGHRLSRDSTTNSLDTIGAVAGDSFEYCIAGYEPDLNEVASTMFAYGCGDLKSSDIPVLLKNNPFFPLFKEHFADLSRPTSGI